MLSPSVVRFRNQEADYASYAAAREQGLVQGRGAARSRSVLVAQEPLSDAASNKDATSSRNQQLPPADALAALERHVRGKSLLQSSARLCCWPRRAPGRSVLRALDMLIVRRLSVLIFAAVAPQRTCLLSSEYPACQPLCHACAFTEPRNRCWNAQRATSRAGSLARGARSSAVADPGCHTRCVPCLHAARFLSFPLATCSCLERRRDVASRSSGCAGNERAHEETRASLAAIFSHLNIDRSTPAAGAPNAGQAAASDDNVSASLPPHLKQRQRQVITSVSSGPSASSGGSRAALADVDAHKQGQHHAFARPLAGSGANAGEPVEHASASRRACVLHRALVLVLVLAAACFIRGDPPPAPPLPSSLLPHRAPALWFSSRAVRADDGAFRSRRQRAAHRRARQGGQGAFVRFVHGARLRGARW